MKFNFVALIPSRFTCASPFSHDSHGPYFLHVTYALSFFINNIALANANGISSSGCNDRKSDELAKQELST
jgi:hypothetical protein